MGNTNISTSSPVQRFQLIEQKKRLLINGFCGSILSEIYQYKQFNVDIITHTVMQHYDYTINSLILHIIHKLPKKNKNYYVLISLQISKMLIQSHNLIRKQFTATTEQVTKLQAQKLETYLNKLNNVNINVMDFVCKSRNSIGKSLPLCPSKTIDNYSFQILCDPTGIYNGKYYRSLSLTDLSMNNGAEISYLRDTKTYNKLDFQKSRLNIWVHKKDMVYVREKNMWRPNIKLKYIRVLTRDEYDHTHCFWRLHCLRLNVAGKLLHLEWIGENRLNEGSSHCVQYLGVVHQYNHIYENESILPQYYEYPCSKHTIWRKITHVAFLSARLALCYNEFCATLPQLNNLGQSSKEIHCKLIQCDSKIYFNNKFVKSIENNLNYNNNPCENEAKLIYYYVIIWLNELIYKCALDHGFDFKKVCEKYVSPYVHYKDVCNPLGRCFQKDIFDGRRIKYYGKDIYFKFDYGCGNGSKNNIKIANEQWVADVVYKLLNCLLAKLQNKNDKEWYHCLNNIQLTPQYKLNKVKLIKK